MIDILNLSSAAATFVVAGMVVFRARQLGLGYPRLVIVLAMFFDMWTVDRLVSPGTPFGYRPYVDGLADVGIMVLLVFLARDSARLSNAILGAVHEAEYRAIEYQRAKEHYRTLVRHRLANPLTVIKGAAQTLDAGVVDAEMRRQLVAAIVASAEAIERVSFDTEVMSPEEHELDPVPRIRDAVRPVA